MCILISLTLWLGESTIHDHYVRSDIPPLQQVIQGQVRMIIDLHHHTLSLHPEDQIYGACIHACTCKWQGASQAHPAARFEKMEKAERWAIALAKPSVTARITPTITALVLPYLPEAAMQCYINLTYIRLKTWQF